MNILIDKELDMTELTGSISDHNTRIHIRPATHRSASDQKSRIRIRAGRDGGKAAGRIIGTIRSGEKENK